MELMEIPSVISLPNNNCTKFLGIAFDGRHFYLLLSQTNKVYQYNHFFEHIGCYETCREYIRLCYDPERYCFWASARKFPNTIFQLNRCMQEIDRFCLPVKSNFSGVVVGISYHCNRGTLLVALPVGVFEFDINDGSATLLYEAEHGWITGILSVAPSYMVTLTADGNQAVLTLDQRNKITQRKAVLSGGLVEQILYTASCDNPIFYELITEKGCYSKLIARQIPCEKLCFYIDPCYQRLCVECHSPEENECTACCGRHPEADILESIAMVEMAISHILNAEGEKLQKVLSTTDDIATIMNVNRDVRATIIQLTSLEQVLYAKLALLGDKNICPHDCPE